jgi:hypothetical protein
MNQAASDPEKRDSMKAAATALGQLAPRSREANGSKAFGFAEVISP